MAKHSLQHLGAGAQYAKLLERPTQRRAGKIDQAALAELLDVAPGRGGRARVGAGALVECTSDGR